MILTEEQIERFKACFSYTPNKELARQFGISLSSVTRLRNIYGLQKSEEYKQQIVARCAVAMNRANLADGYRKQAKNAKRLNELGLSNRFPKGVSSYDLFGVEKVKAIHKRVSETHKRIVEEERRRIRWGLPQRTKMKLNDCNIPRMSARSYLRRHGYIVPKGSMVAFYSADTERKPHMEVRYAHLHGLRFEKITEK